MANYVITTDSTCDLTAEQIEKYGIVVKPLTIFVDGKEYSDNVDIDALRVLEYVQNGGMPKTAATPSEQYKEFFEPFVNKGKKVIHFNISAQLSSCNQNAVVASKEFPGKVFVVDSKQLSTGQGLLILKACRLLEEGKSVEEVYEYICSISEKVQTSFVLDRLDVLHKGGRCSLAQLLGAKLLKLHPSLYMNEGFLKVKKKYQGNMRRSIEGYVNDLALEYHNYDKSICFVTHCQADQEYVDLAVAKVKELFEFEEVVISTAGTTITSHCGKNTLGVLFIAE